MEVRAIAEICPGVPVTAYKGKVGECYGASGPMSVLCAIADMTAGRITGAGASGAAVGNLNLVTGTLTRRVEYVLVNAFSCDGNCSCIVLKNLKLQGEE